MKSSPIPALPLLLIGICLVTVFFSQLSRLDGLPPKGPLRYQVRTRFTLLKPPVPNDGTDEKVWRQKQMATITSTELLLHVVDRLNLEQDWRMSARQAAARLKQKLRAEFKPGTGIVSLTVLGSNRDEILDIADAVRDSYEEYCNNEALETARRLARNADARDAARTVKTIEILNESEASAIKGN